MWNLSTQKQVLRCQPLKNMEEQFDNLESQNEEALEEVDVDALIDSIQVKK